MAEVFLTPTSSQDEETTRAGVLELVESSPSLYKSNQPSDEPGLWRPSKPPSPGHNGDPIQEPQIWANENPNIEVSTARLREIRRQKLKKRDKENHGRPGGVGKPLKIIDNNFPSAPEVSLEHADLESSEESVGVIDGQIIKIENQWPEQTSPFGRRKAEVAKAPDSSRDYDDRAGSQGSTKNFNLRQNKANSFISQFKPQGEPQGMFPTVVNPGLVPGKSLSHVLGSGANPQGFSFGSGQPSQFVESPLLGNKKSLAPLKSGIDGSSLTNKYRSIADKQEMVRQSYSNQQQKFKQGVKENSPENILRSVRQGEALTPLRPDYLERSPDIHKKKLQSLRLSQDSHSRGQLSNEKRGLAVVQQLQEQQEKIKLQEIKLLKAKRRDSEDRNPLAPLAPGNERQQMLLKQLNRDILNVEHSAKESPLKAGKLPDAGVSRFKKLPSESGPHLVQLAPLEKRPVLQPVQCARPEVLKLNRSQIKFNE